MNLDGSIDFTAIFERGPAFESLVKPLDTAEIRLGDLRAIVKVPGEPAARPDGTVAVTLEIVDVLAPPQSRHLWLAHCERMKRKDFDGKL